MLSHSRSHLHPASNHKASAGDIASSLEVDDQGSPDQIQLWPYQKATLPVGNYAISVSQDVELPSSHGGENVPLNTPDKLLRVSRPRFRLADPADVHSVHPAPGHSAYARTLAHVVFNHPTTPWEREVMSKHETGSNNLPSMAVLTFSEEELVLDPKVYENLGFKVDKDEKPTGCGSIVTTASKLVEPECGIKSTLNAPGANGDFKADDKVSLLLLDSELFKAIFTSYNDDDERAPWTGHGDVSKFAMMAHTQKGNGGFTATAFAEDSSAHQPQHSVLVSPRTGPPGRSSPTRVVSHLIELEDVEKIALSAEPVSGQYVGLVSLHAWEWMSVPEGAVDFAHVMTELGRNVQPLLAPYNDKTGSDKEQQSPPSEVVQWLKAKAEAGFVLKPHTDITGAQSSALMRGPLIPVRPDHRKAVEAFSLAGEGLALVDESTGIPDASYSSAWTLGRSMLMSDRTLTANLLRLRGTIHAEAVRRAKSQSLRQNGYGIVGNKETYLSTLEDTVKHLQDAQNLGSLAQRRDFADRWTRTNEERDNLPVARLSNESSFSPDDYTEQVKHVTTSVFGYESQDFDGKSIPPRPIDADAAAIRAWAVDRFMLAGIPLHMLVLDPTMLPPESIRTFCVDHLWIDNLVDGGLSLANHHTRDDEIRRAIKECINRYLATPVDGVTPQLPRWGFFMRSIAVSAFPDLRVEAPLPPNAPASVREIVFMQVLADDVLICLFDRLPGEEELNYIRICQPPHQQSFSLGNSLSDQSLSVSFRGVPAEAGQNVDAHQDRDYNSDQLGQIFDLKARMLRPDKYMEQYFEEMRNKTGLFKFKEGDKPSSLLATQLKMANLRLKLTVAANRQAVVAGGEDSAPDPDRWTRATVRLSLGSRQDPDSSKSPPVDEPPNAPPAIRAPPSNTVFPSGPRRRIHPLISPYVNASLEVRRGDVALDSLQNVSTSDSKVLIYRLIPQHISCSLAYDPGNATNVINATETPIDAFFNLSAEEASGFPKEVEVRVPVALSSGEYPSRVQDGSKGLLVIPGTFAQPVLPVIEDLNESKWWSYDCKLAVGGLYAFPTDGSLQEGDSVPIGSEKLVLLIIKVKPRFENLVPNKTTAFTTSFALRGVTFVLPPPDESAPPREIPSRTTYFDTLWTKSTTSGGREKLVTTVRTTKMTTRPAIIGRILDDQTDYHLTSRKMTINLELSRLPPINSKVCVTTKPQEAGSPFIETISLPTNQVRKQPDGKSYLFTIIADWDEKRKYIPLETWLVVVAPDGGQLLGPESAPIAFQRVPSAKDLEDSCFCWRDDRLVISWIPRKPGSSPYSRKYVVWNRSKDVPTDLVAEVDAETESVDFPADAVKQYIDEEKMIWVHVSIEIPKGSRLHGVIATSHVALCLPATMSSPLEVESKRSKPAPPLSNSGLASVRFWHKYSEDDEGSIESELWYWRTNRNLACLRCYRQHGHVQEIDDSYTTPVPAAGAMAVFPMEKDVCLKLVWIGEDGSVNLCSRPDTSIRVSWRHDHVLAPAGSASVLGGGIVVACSEMPIKERRFVRNPVVWWLGPRGEIFGRRALPSENNLDNWTWVDIGSYSSLPAGSVNISPTLARPAQMATAWAYEARNADQSAYLFWVHSNGDLMTTSSFYHKEPDPEHSKTVVVHRNVRAAPGTALAAYISWNDYSPSVNVRVHVSWIAEDGSICITSAFSLFNGLRNNWSPIRKIASSGAADPLTDLCLLGHTWSRSAALAWFSPQGKLNIASAYAIFVAIKEHWSSWSWIETSKSLPPGQPPRLGRAEAPDGKGINDLYFPAGDGKWDGYSVDLGSIRKKY